MGFNFTVIAPLIPTHFGFFFVFGCGVSFLVSSSIFLLMTVQQLAVILVFSEEGVRARPSTLPSWFLHQKFFFIYVNQQILSTNAEEIFDTIQPPLMGKTPGKLGI